MKKIAILLTTMILILNFSSLHVDAITFTPDEEVFSEAVYLVNTDTDTIIYEKNADKREYPASLTKIMTAILVLENIPDLKNTMIEAPPEIFDELYQQGASTADFRPYEIASAEDLMYGMMLQSACEAASILAYQVGNGSVEDFITMMNDKAKEIGANDTNFTNAHGLFNSNQYTTARDMAKITKYAMALPKFTEISSTSSYELKTTNKHTETRTVFHTNTMMSKPKGGKYYYPYIKGIKTGTLDESGRCLVSSASRDGYNYMLVTLNAPMKDAEGNDKFFHYLDAIALYDWAFDNFKQTSIINTEEELGEVPVKFSDGKDYVLVKPAEGYSLLWQQNVDLTSIQRIVKLNEDVIAPVVKGDKLGTIELKFAGETITTIDLVADSDVERSLLKYNLELARQFTSSVWFKTAIAVVILLVLIYIIIYSNITRKKRRKMKRVSKKRQF